jgi:hypothetical protein
MDMQGAQCVFSHLQLFVQSDRLPPQQQREDERSAAEDCHDDVGDSEALAAEAGSAAGVSGPAHSDSVGPHIMISWSGLNMAKNVINTKYRINLLKKNRSQLFVKS